MGAVDRRARTNPQGRASGLGRRSLLGLGVVIAVAAQLVLVGSDAAGAVEVGSKLVASDASAGDGFGISVAADGSRLVVGALQWEFGVPATGPGAAYMYEPEGAGRWLETRLAASDGATSDRFGISVAAAGDRVIVGADQHDAGGSNAGAVYIYQRGAAAGWSETKLTASDGEAGDNLGVAVAADGDRLVAGAPQDDDRAANAGAVYVFEPDGVTGWAERKLTASDGAANDFFGLATAVAGELVVVGAGFADAKGPNSGAAYIFEPDATGGWTETKLTASDGAAGDLFGAAVAASGDRVVVGAWQAGATEAGAVYVFDSDGRGGWAETRLTASDGAANNFGRSVAISGDTIVVGANGDDDIGTDAGAVYVLESDGAGGWKQTKLTAADGAEGDFLGLSVAASGTSAVAGAPRDADGGVGSGSAYLLALRPAATCNGLAATLEGSPNDDVLAGTPGDDVIVGGAGNDEIRGNGGNDTICAGDGDDTVIGGGGNDTLFGEEGNDLVKGLRGNDSVQGGPGEDRLQGNGGDDVLAGGDGKDKMWGGIGIDTLRGGVGNDQLHGGPGNDTLSGAAGTDRLWGDADDDMIGGGANSDFLYGGIGVDELRGGTGNDRIFGWTGDDRLFGEAGRDQLRGQQGDDLVDGGPDHDWCSQETVWRNCETSL